MFRFSQVQEAMVTLSTFLEQQQSNVIELRTKLLPLGKSMIISLVQDSHQTKTINFYWSLSKSRVSKLLYFISVNNHSISTTKLLLS